jgi:light-regulated signal transduction histidine kinase (bacteriophytochrome)
VILPEVDIALDLSSCENEPIHIPGFIQPHGVLLALDSTTSAIEQVSENSRLLLGPRRESSSETRRPPFSASGNLRH